MAKVKINVGGRVFETSTSTVNSCGSNTVLANAVKTALANEEDVFFDADPDIFALLLKALRTGSLGSNFGENEALIKEAEFYGVTDAVKQILTPPELDGLDIQRVGSVITSGSDFPSAIAAANDGSLWVAHGSKVTVFDWALRKHGTTLTEFNNINSLHRISDTHVAAGAIDFPGLHIYDVAKKKHIKTFIWSDATDPRIYNTTVQAISSSSDMIFGSFLSGHKMDNTILLFDKNRMQIIKELARQSGTSAGHSKHATKLQWLPSLNLLMGYGVHGGPFGYSGYLRFWDLRTDKPAFELIEPNNRNPSRDSFGDVAASEDSHSLFKVGVVSGVISTADLRKLDGMEWLNLVDNNPSLEGSIPGADHKLLAYNKQLYCCRGSDVEVWSELHLVVDDDDNDDDSKNFRKNFLEHPRRLPGHEVTQMEAGGNRLFIARRQLQSVEVWETR